MLLVILTAAAAAAPAVEVLPAPGPRPAVTVRATAEAVSVPACRGVVWEAFDADSAAFRPISTAPCGALAPPARIDKDGTRFEIDADPGVAQVVRAVVVVGRGCTADVPFPLAACDEVTAVEGPPMTVREPGPAEG